MRSTLLEALKPLFIDNPLGSQEHHSDPLIIAKIFDTFGTATWYLTEYDVEQQLGFGYVTGLMAEEWGYVSVKELSTIRHRHLKIPRIERDKHFEPIPFSTINKMAS